MSQAIFVIGGGNVGYTTAGYLSAQGYEVTVVQRQPSGKPQQTIVITDGEGRHLKTTSVKITDWKSLGQFPSGAIILVTTASNAINLVTEEIRKRAPISDIPTVVFTQNGLIWHRLVPFCASLKCARLLYHYGMTAHEEGGVVKVKRITDPKYTLAAEGIDQESHKLLINLFKYMDADGSTQSRAVQLSVENDVLAAEFNKILINAAGNGPNTIFGFLEGLWTMADLSRSTRAVNLARGILGEIVDIASAMKITVREGWSDEILERWSTVSAHHVTSMAQAFRKSGSVMEIHEIYGELVSLAEEKGITVPFLVATKKMLEFLNSQNADRASIISCLNAILDNALARPSTIHCLMTVEVAACSPVGVSGDVYLSP